MNKVQRQENKLSSLLYEVENNLFIILLLSLITLMCYQFKVFPFSSKMIEIVVSENMSFTFDQSLLFFTLIFSFIDVIIFYLFQFIVKPSNIKPDLGKKNKHLFPFVILSLFGILAYICISVLLSGFSVNNGFAIVIATILVSIYSLLIYKMYLENKTFSNVLFWEIFRFAIVGLVAAVFDFIVCYLVQFILFSGNTASYVTIVSTACGFTIGVIINYLMSTFMVYKNAKTNISRTFKGIVIFLVLAIIGLFIGIGIQYFLYDYLYLNVKLTFFSYPIDFIIRTLIVMVYNYISRKLILYR